MNILLLGSGGREHAMATKIAESTLCDQLYIAPGNAGMNDCGTTVPLDANNFDAVGQFVVNHEIQMVVVGPEAPLVGGIVDYFARSAQLKDVMVIGPSKAAAQLEGSKEFAKDFMLRNGIPTARYKAFRRETMNEGANFLETLKPPYVLKADGLAGGKGVVILNDLNEAKQTLAEMLTKKKFGNAGKTVVIEEYLNGIEISVFVLTDGKHFKVLPAAKDYKRIGDGDMGPNTGGMGSVSPVPFADKEFMKKVEHDIIAPTIKGIHREKLDYRGFLFIGLMNVEGNPYVIEYNCRMGDPETEVVFPRIQSDIVEQMGLAWHQHLTHTALDINPQTAASVMLVSGGYPESYKTGFTIEGLEKITDSTVFHAGTALNDKGEYVTNGGRVLCFTSLANTLPEALLKSYQSAKLVSWRGCYYRKDIGQDLLKYLMKP
ncbi:MAG: phosphoribosylamine--glycine ligase [Bacteroidales bacterium]|nr:phosphoribosylamine--glycine ligase [Bacteroidales bacterium]